MAKREFTEKDFGLIFDYMLELIRLALKDCTQEQLAKQCGVDKSALSRYLGGDRGEGISLRYWLKLIVCLGGTMAEVARRLGDEDAAIMLELTVGNRDFIKKLRRIAEAGGKEWKKIQAEVDYLETEITKK